MTAQPPLAGPGPPRLCRPPALEPPAVPVIIRPPTLRLRAQLSPELPFPPDPATVPGPRVATAEADPFGPAPTSRAALPDPATHARRLVLAALEAIGGRRPVQQLMPHLSEAAYQRLTSRLHRATLGDRTSAVGRTVSRRSGRLGTAGSRGGVGRTRITLGRTVVCEPADGVAEATVLATWGDRTHAVAVRLEGVDGRWRCLVLAIL